VVTANVANAALLVVGLGAMINYGMKNRQFGNKISRQKETTTFSSVAGADQAKEALSDIVGYLKDPTKYSRLGARVSKGVLLTGPSGTGKTLLARALAGETGRPFYSINATELISKYYGEGPERVRLLFEDARKHAPSIIFIDEIDAIGGDRSAYVRRSAYHEILNQLLVCMDGFDQSEKPVIVVAATNHEKLLDLALTRPGRFDQTIHVPNPDLKSRIDILNIYINKVTAEQSLDVTKIARGTIGFSGAELANLVNEAAVIATKRGSLTVDMADFEEARDRIIMGGAQSKTMVITERDRKITAYHEAGHALVNLMLPGLLDPLHKVTITPRGDSLGVTYSLPEKDKYNTNKNEMLAMIAMTCGGRAAEELVFGEITTGALSDFDKATSIARSMVCEYGMSEDIGKAVYKQKYGALSCSSALAEKIDIAVNKIIEECYAHARKILVDHRDKLDLLANALLDKETLDASEIYKLLSIAPRVDLKIS
jgi:cell division protease FtsH